MIHRLEQSLITSGLIAITLVVGPGRPGLNATAQEPEGGPSDQDKLQAVAAADGHLQLKLPAGWQQVDPRSRILEFEFEIPPDEGEEASGRLTMMQSGGGVDANIARWKGQFETDSDAPVKETEELEVDGLTVHLVDLSGTFLDRARPFGPATRRADYGMLAAIVETAGAGDYFIKFTAPSSTVDEHRKAFRRMIETLEQGGN